MSFLPQNSFYRTPRYSGGMNVPGAPGNIQTLPYFGELLNPTQMPYYPGQDYGGVQQLAQGPNTPIRYYPGMGYGPYGPGNGGMQPTPMRQALVPPMGFQNKFVS